MSLRTNAVKVQAFAGALFGVQVGTTTMAQVNADITSGGGLANALNSYYASSFGSATTASVAATVAANLGLTGSALTAGAAYVEAQLNAAAPGARGAVISNILDLFAGLASDATFGAAATAWNAKVDAANAYTGAANVAIGFVAPVPAGVFALTAGVDTSTGAATNDTFNATNLTFNANDILDGGAGTDTLNITNNGTAALTLPAAVVSNIENINVRNLASTASATGSDEKATVTFNSLVQGQTISAAGLTFTAGAAGATAAQVATAFAGGVADSTDAGGAIGATIAGTINGYTVATGPSATSVVFTSSTAKTNVSNLQVTGSAQSVIPQVSSLTLATNPANTDNYFTFKVNGLTVQTAAAGAANATGLATLTNSVASTINAVLGREVAKSDGTSVVSIVSESPVTISDITAAGTSNATTVTNALAPTKQTITWATVPGATTAWTFFLNGVQYSTATLAANTVEAGRDAFLARINEVVGSTVATASSTDAVILDFQGKGFVLSKIDDGSSVPTLSATTASRGVVASSAATVSIVDGVSDTSAATYTTTVDATKFASAKEFNSDLSTASVTITGVAKDQAVGMKGNGTVATGGLDATYGATVTAATVNLSGGTNGGAVALTANGATTVTMTSTGAPLTSTGLTGTNTVASLNIGGTATSTLNIVADSNLSTGTGAVTLAAKTLNVSGAATSVILDSDTALSASNLTTIDASGLTAGGVTLGLVTGITSFKGGQGADTVTTAGIATGSVIDAGAGADLLIIGSAGDLDTAAEGARYQNFETVRAASGSYDAQLVGSATAIQMTGAGTLSNLNATQAGNVQIRTSGAYTMSLINGTGTSDVLSMRLGTGTTTAAATNISTGLTANGFETINLATNHGPTADTGNSRTSTIDAFTADSVTAINLTGSAFTITNPATTKKVTIDASALVGNGATTPVGLIVNSTGNLVNGSTVIGSAVRDEFTIAAEGSTFNGGDGDDLFVIGGATPAALTAADGVTDLVLSGGANSISTTSGKDTLEYKDSTITDDLTLTDTNFVKVSGMESLKLSNTGVLSLTTGAAFNAAFADGAKITTGTIAVDKYLTLAAGLSTVAIDLTVDATSLDGTHADEDITITTGSANDKVTVTGDATWVGGTTASATISVSTLDGDDTISITIGTLADDHDNQAIVVTGGKGKDTITLVKVNGGDSGAAGSQTHLGNAKFVMANGDSTTDNYDVIVGFDVGTGTDLSDNLDFAGSSNAVSAFSNSTDFGVILSHSITDGVVTFDDIANYTTALVINSSNLADVLGYLAANTANNGVVAFTFDSDNNGSAESTLVYHNGDTGNSDSLVMLKDVVLTGLATAINETSGFAQIS